VSIAAVVLAAGASRRLGSPKQLEMVGGETLLERAVRVARGAGCSPVIVVLGAEAPLMPRSGMPVGVLSVMNNQWAEGMASSVRAGVRACDAAVEGVVLMTCDQPAITAEHLQSLMSGHEIRASRYAGRNGVPAFFPRRYFDELLALTGDTGARALLVAAEAVDLKDGDLDVDTAEDLKRARELFG
jgi:CTP:molybdopterin cytidylyltransferase MocA